MEEKSKGKEEGIIDPSLKAKIEKNKKKIYKDLEKELEKRVLINH